MTANRVFKSLKFGINWYVIWLSIKTCQRGSICTYQRMIFYKEIFLKRCNILEKMLFLKFEPIPIEKTDPN